MRGADSASGRRRLRAVDVERLENTSFVAALGLHPAGTDGKGAAGGGCHGCTLASCVGISCTGAGQCVSAGPCLVLSVAA